MEFKNIISGIRKDNNLSQSEMAAKLFVTRQAVSRWENGETFPNIETLKTISKEFEISPGALLGLSENTVCQSCGMDLNSLDDFGTNSDTSLNTDFCRYCYQKGAYSHERTIDEMVESNLRFLDEYNAAKGLSYTPEQARTELKQHLLTLKRWKLNN